MLWAKIWEGWSLCHHILHRRMVRKLLLLLLLLLLLRSRRTARSGSGRMCWLWARKVNLWKLGVLESRIWVVGKLSNLLLGWRFRREREGGCRDNRIWDVGKLGVTRRRVRIGWTGEDVLVIVNHKLEMKTILEKKHHKILLMETSSSQ